MTFEHSPSARTSTPAPRTGRTVAVTAAVAVLAGVTGGAVGATVAADDSAAPPAERTVGIPTSGRDAASAVADVAARVLPSVVSIDVRSRAGAGSGSGVVLDDAGHVLTNNHVVESGVDGAISVVLHDGRRVDADIVGLDPVTDLAVLALQDHQGLRPIELGSSRDVQVGDAVVAVGSPLGLSGTVTTGIVSALDRTVRTTPQTPLLGAIQTDAAINPGNSGGALVDDQGRLVGINTAISTTGGGGSIGLGFAIPVDQAWSIADELIRTGRATHPSLGVGATTVDTEELRGARLQDVPAASTAADAGLREGDVVTAVEQVPVTGVDELVLELREKRVGDSVRLTYVRDGREAVVEVLLADRRA